MLENHATCAIINWLPIIYMFSFSSCLSEKVYNGKHYIHGRVAELLIAGVELALTPMSKGPLMFTLPIIKPETGQFPQSFPG